MERRYHCTCCGIELLTEEGFDYDFNDRGEIAYKERCGVCGGFYAAGFKPDKLIHVNGDYELISQSMAVNPEQVAAHRKLFPSVEMLDNGCPKFSSVRQQDRYIEQVGMVKVPCKNKRSRNAQRIA